ncbi:HET-domain-containing protein [Acephala macrosclerotiorum]|nr:HET-domain-containing protein [Acephala macrosclerotiorum]
MEIYCDSCKEVARQLANMLDTRRRGFPFKSESSEGGGLLAEFGTIGEIIHKAKFMECSSCKDLEQEITRWEKESDNFFTRLDHFVVGIEITEVTKDQDSHGDPQAQPLYAIARDPTHQDSRQHLVNFYPLERGAPNDDCGRLFDLQKIDIGLIKGWLRCCDLTHGGHCSIGLTDRLPEDTLPTRILLVDLEKRCLSYGTLSDKYVTLSYVWGQVDRDTLKATRDNLQELLKPGGLDFARQDLIIPETIRDLMRLAVQLEIRYVWVDSICIVQDGDDLQEQLNGMAAIYSSAYLTVIVDGPDANFGLPGIGNGAKSRNTPCHIIRLPDMTCVFKDNIDSSDKYSMWKKRAWTFQEGLFSRRHLFFEVPGNFSWGCRSQYWFETYETPSEKLDWVKSHGGNLLPDWAYFGFSDLNFQWPDTRRWCDLVQQYGNGKRELTNDCDAINAIAGLINVMEHVCAGGFHYGVPELFFDIYLLWDIDLGYGPDKKIPKRRECEEIPSWSFLGWKDCGLDLFWWRNSMDYAFLDPSGYLHERFSSDCEVGSIVKWFKQDQACTKLIAVANKFHVCRSQWVNKVPQGWSRHEKDGRTYYKHESIEHSEFRYPIALPESAGKVGLIKEQFSHYLHFKAVRAWLNIGTAVGQNPTEYLTVSLVDDHGRWAGAIRLPFSHRNDLTTLPDTVSKDMRFELIAIATGKLRDQGLRKNVPGYKILRIPEWHCEERPKRAEFYEFYFVLWIEWHDGIAYRRGLGRVEKQAWEQLSAEEIDIKLG